MADSIEALDPSRAILIDGQALTATRLFPVENPADETVIAVVADGGPDDAAAAVDAAANALAAWSPSSPRLRSDL